MDIDAALVRALLRAQFPQWADLEIVALAPAGWDNRSFRVGRELVARLPSAAAYAPQVEKEQHWLSRLAPGLPLLIPTPIAMGAPGAGYAWNWSLYRWIDGDVASATRVDDTTTFARDLGGFLASLQGIDASAGPPPGDHNFHRGGSLDVYAAQVDRALAVLGRAVDGDAIRTRWQQAAATRWRHQPVWVHGDISPGNLLVRSGRLAAVLDFGNLAVGDPACDLAIGWTWLDTGARATLRSRLPLDEGTWLRGCAWALWKALVVAARMSPTNAADYNDPMRVIARCLREH